MADIRGINEAAEYARSVGLDNLHVRLMDNVKMQWEANAKSLSAISREVKWETSCGG